MRPRSQFRHRSYRQVSVQPLCGSQRVVHRSKRNWKWNSLPLTPIKPDERADRYETWHSDVAFHPLANNRPPFDFADDAKRSPRWSLAYSHGPTKHRVAQEIEDNDMQMNADR